MPTLDEGWPFDDSPNVAVITTRQVTEDNAPILLVSHDEEDGGWQFLRAGRCSKKMRVLLRCGGSGFSTQASVSSPTSRWGGRLRVSQPLTRGGVPHDAANQAAVDQKSSVILTFREAAQITHVRTASDRRRPPVGTPRRRDRQHQVGAPPAVIV